MVGEDDMRDWSKDRVESDLVEMPHDRGNSELYVDEISR